MQRPTYLNRPAELYAWRCQRCGATWASSDGAAWRGTNHLCPDCIALLPVVQLE